MGFNFNVPKNDFKFEYDLKEIGTTAKDVSDGVSLVPVDLKQFNKVNKNDFKHELYKFDTVRVLII